MSSWAFGSGLREVGSNAGEVSESQSKQAKSKGFFLVFYIGCHEKVCPRFRVELPTSNDPIN